MYYAIDVSKWQGGQLGHRQKRRNPPRHLRAGYGNSVASLTAPSATWPTASRDGVAWGVYWYSYATSPEQARQEASLPPADHPGYGPLPVDL